MPPAAAVSVCQRVPGAGQPLLPLQLSGRRVELSLLSCLLRGTGVFVVLLLCAVVAVCGAPQAGAGAGAQVGG